MPHAEDSAESKEVLRALVEFREEYRLAQRIAKRPLTREKFSAPARKYEESELYYIAHPKGELGDKAGAPSYGRPEAAEDEIKIRGTVDADHGPPSEIGLHHFEDNCSRYYTFAYSCCNSCAAKHRCRAREARCYSKPGALIFKS